MPRASRNIHARLRIFLLADYTLPSYFVNSRVRARPSEIHNRSLIERATPPALRCKSHDRPPFPRPVARWDESGPYDAPRHLVTPYHVTSTSGKKRAEPKFRPGSET